jgi:hypothetical protein
VFARKAVRSVFSVVSISTTAEGTEAAAKENRSSNPERPAGKLLNMSEPRKHGTAGVWAAAILVGIVTMPFIYLLLLGPLQFLAMKDLLTADVWDALSMPMVKWLENIGSQPSWFWDTYDDYLVWWVDLAQAEGVGP